MLSLPSVCQVCGRWPARPVCAACLRRFAPPAERCRRCARVMPSGQPVCGDCLGRASPVRHCMAAVDYRYPWDGLIARFKFRGQPGWAPTLAALMWERLAQQDLLAPDTLLVPIPVSTARLAERGYNQAWELCRALRRRTALPALADALVRVGEAPDQHRLPLSQRLSNLQGVFAAHPLHAQRLRGAQVLLIDDVRTSGATLENAAAALRQAGCAEVDALVLARTPAAAEPAARG